MLGTVIAPLPVNHHRRRQHQTADPGGEHLRQQHRGGEIVVAAIGGCVGGVDAGTHHGGLVTHQIDTANNGASALASRTSTRWQPGGSTGFGPCAAASSASTPTTS